MDRLLSMRVFQQVVDHGGFAAAARALELSASAVTRLVGDLERHLGARLLQRTTRRVSLTDTGQEYLARARVILAAIDEAESCAHDQTDEMAGPLRIHSPPALAIRMLAPLIAEFRRRHPRVALELIVDNFTGLAVEDYDLTLFGAGSRCDANVVARPVINVDVLLWAATGYLRGAAPLREPADLRRHACLRLRYPGARLREWALIDPSAADRRTIVDVTPALVANDVDVLMRAARAGAGISAHPFALVADEVRIGELRRVLAPWIVGRLTVYAALPSTKYVPARTRAFLEFLIEQTRRRADEAELAFMPPRIDGAASRGVPAYPVN
ncbi:MAG: Transcriptional regulator, LysR family [Burkholderiaceae bacterium]|jgi:DNA-binding transcriptional LysR family regulator|nr:MAG: Transcriptional regulator, LysR family [Burkholderiaceae bacterium]